MSEPLRVSIAGGVRHAASYLEHLSGRNDYEVLFLCDLADAPDWALKEAEELATRYALPFRGNLDDVDPTAVDIALICTEPVRHAQAAIETLGQGVPTIVDKPVATSIEDGLRLKKAWLESAVMASGLTRIHVPAIQQARLWVDSGVVGWPRSLNIRFLSNGRRFSESVERPDLVVNQNLSGGGEIMNFLGYPIDYARFLTGCEPLRVFALAESAFFPAHINASVEDVAVLAVEFTYGLQVSITVGRVPVAPTSGPIASSLTLMGSHGHLTLEDDSPALVVHGIDQVVSRRMGGESGEVALHAYFDDVARGLTDESDLRYDLGDALVTIGVIEAAHKSLKSGQPEPIKSEMTIQK